MSVPLALCFSGFRYNGMPKWASRTNLEPQIRSRRVAKTARRQQCEERRLSLLVSEQPLQGKKGVAAWAGLVCALTYHNAECPRAMKASAMDPCLLALELRNHHVEDHLADRQHRLNESRTAAPSSSLNLPWSCRCQPLCAEEHGSNPARLLCNCLFFCLARCLFLSPGFRAQGFPPPARALLAPPTVLVGRGKSTTHYQGNVRG